jgi:hypothetical protein
MNAVFFRDFFVCEFNVTSPWTRAFKAVSKPKNVYRSLKEAGVGVVLTTLRAALTIEGLGS